MTTNLTDPTTEDVLTTADGATRGLRAALREPRRPAHPAEGSAS
ncbi:MULTISPECIES: hypothetical protein [unclassified Saccharothrix]